MKIAPGRAKSHGDEPPSPRAVLPDPAGLLGLILFLGLFALAGSAVLRDADTLWHIKAGQVILEGGRLLTTDVFSHTAFGQDWTSHEWLAEIAMAAGYDYAGLPGVALAAFVLVGISFTLLFQAALRVAGAWSALLAIAIAAPLAYSHLFARPHLFTWLFGALTLYLLIRDDRWMWVLPPVTAIWSNLHGGVLVGLLLQGVFLSGNLIDLWPGSVSRWHLWWNSLRRPAYVLLLSLLALGCNPFGYSLLLFPFDVSSPVFSAAINEWESPDLQVFWYARLWVVGLVVLAAWYGFRSRWSWRLLVPLMLYMALGHVRHLSIAGMFIAPWVAMALHAIPVRRPGWLKPSGSSDPLVLSPWSGPLVTVGVAALLFVIAVAAPPWWQSFAEERFTLPPRFTAEAIAYLEQGYPDGNLLNDYSVGGYLLFMLDPPPRVFIDGRADMYGEEIFSDYLTLTELGPDTEGILDRYAIGWVVFPRSHRLVLYLRQQPEWREVYEDAYLSILIREESDPR